MKLNIPDGLHVRPAVASDKPFLEKLYRSTRADLQLIDGEQDMIDSLIDMQFKAQSEGYGEQFPNAIYFIIEKHHEAIGRASLDFGPNEIRLIDISFLPQARGHGFGKVIIQSFQLAAAQAGAPMTLCVAQDNRTAKALYIQLGFEVETVRPPNEYLIWYPPAMRPIVGV